MNIEHIYTTLDDLDRNRRYSAVKLLEAALEKTRGSTTEDLVAFAEWAPRVSLIISEQSLSEGFAHHVMALAMCSHAMQAPDFELPDTFVAYLGLVPQIRFYGHTISLEIARGVCALMPEKKLYDALQQEWALFYRMSNVSLDLFTLIEDPILLKKLVFSTVSNSSADPEDVAAKLATLGEHIGDAARASWRKDATTREAKILVELLTRMPHPDNASVFVAALGHKSKPVQELAKTGLRTLGPESRPTLEDGAKARKRAVKEFCQLRLDELDEGPVDEPTELDAFERLDEKTRAKMIEKLESIRSDESKWDGFVSRTVKKDPMAWLIAQQKIYYENVGYLSNVKLLKRIVYKTKDDEARHRLWQRQLEFLCAANIPDSYDQWHMMQMVEAAPRALFAESMRAILPHSSGSLTLKMATLYMTRGEAMTPEMLELGLRHASKKVRDATVENIPSHDAEFDVSPILEVFEERKKALRKAAAQALANSHVEALGPHLVAIRALASNEKVAEVAAILEDVVARVGDA